ncbi:MAG TPA: hypothetical protein VLI44_06180 [Sporolactobacillaceae bacterium]|nr:hypothetical protein [Sporolactobacillaceae bacterium]
MFQRGRKARFLVIVAFGLALSGCVTNAGWQYEPAPAQVSTTRAPVSVGVLQFQDQRAAENSTYFWSCLIPLVPYCTADYHRLESANGFVTAGTYNFRPSEDLAKATADELRQTSLFHDVFVTDRATDPGAQLLLRGTIVSTDWNGSRYSYLVGPYTGILYVFGLPIGSVQDTLKLKLELVDPLSSQILWSQAVDQDYAKTEGFYYNFGQDFGYPAMFREGIQPALASLKSYVASQPPNAWQRYQKTGQSGGEGR